MTDMPVLEWPAEELATWDCYDARILARGQLVLATLAAHPSLSIPAACGSPAATQATYDLCANPQVNADALLAAHAAATQARIAEYRQVLLIADLTEFDYSRKTVAQELGYIADNKNRGFFFLPLFAVAVSGEVLGLANSQRYLRELRDGTSQSRKHQPITEKETRYILAAYQQACALQAATPGTRCLFIHDRGGDLYEIYAEAQQQARPADFLIRGREYERCLQQVVQVGGASPTTASQARARKLNELLRVTPAIGQLTFTAPATATRAARPVVQEIRTVTVTLVPPVRTGVKLAPATLQVIECREVDPPAGEAPLHWLFYTNLPATTAAEAQWAVARYLQRWDVELYFKILKSGCRVEQLYLQKKARLETAFALYAIVAWRIFALVRLGRASPDLPCTLLLSSEEWQVLVGHFTGRVPSQPPTLQEAVRLLGRLGGNLGRRGDGEPGIQSLWIGLGRLHDMVLGARTGTALRARAAG